MKVKIRSLAIFLLLSSCLSLAAFPGKVSKTYREAVRLYENGMYDRARVLFEELNSKGDDPMSEGYALLCAINQKAAGYEESIASYVVRNGNTPLSSKIYHLYGQTLFDEGRYAEAASFYDKVPVKSLSGKAVTELLFKRAYCDYALENYDAARKGFDKVIKRAKSEYTAPAQYASGFMAYNENKFAEAFPLFEAAAKDERFEQQSLYYMLECKFMEKDYNYVAAHGDDIFEKVPEERKGRLARILSESYLVQGNAGKAKKYFDAVAAENKPVDNPADAFYAGSLHYTLGNYQEAIDNFSRMGSRRDSTGQIASYQMGYSYIQVKNKVSAMDAFREASELDFDKKIREDALFNYAKLAFDLNHDPAPFKDYLSQYKESGRNDQIYDYIAVASLFNHDYAGAIEAYDNIDALTQDMRLNYMKANYLRAQQLISGGAWKDAMPCLKATTFFTSRQDNLNKLARYYLAEANFKTGNYAEAQKGFSELYNQSALDNKTEGKRIPYDLAYAFFDDGKYTQAASWFDNYIASGDQQCREDAMVRRADCDFIGKNYKGAAEAYGKVLSEFSLSDNLYPRYQQGIAYGLLGKKKEKISTLSLAEGYPADAPFYSESLYELGRTYVSDNNESKAEKCFRKIVSTSKDSIFVAKSLIELGMIARNASDQNKALSYYKTVVEKFKGSQSSEDALLAIESIYQSAGEPEKYIEYIESLGGPAKPAWEKEAVYFSSAEQVFLSGNYEKALVALDKYLEIYPEGSGATRAIYYKAECYKALGSKEKACEAYAEVLSAPGSGEFKEMSLLNFANLSYGLEHFTEAYSAYSKLLGASTIEGNAATAKLGMMRSAFRARQYKDAIDAAEGVLADSGLRGNAREAEYVNAKSLLATSRRDAAFASFRKLAADPTDAEGAEAAYMVIQDLYDQGRFDEVESAVYKFAEAAPSQAYWLAKSFITLGDSFAENEKYRQAKATFESVLNGYEPDPGHPDEILDNVRMRLERLNQIMNNL